MKKISLFILFSFAFHVQAAVHLSDDGTGQVAIVPFYSVANGLETHLKVINTTDQFKAVKVNVRTADLSAHPVYSLNVYLTPHDTWRFAMGQRNDFITAINTDQTCTLGLTNPADQAVDWSDYIWDTGFMEVIEMGEFDSNALGFYNNGNDLCTNINLAWSDGGQWANNPLKGLLPASDGLRVSTELLNVAKGFSFDVPVTLLADFYPTDTLTHTSVDSHKPDLDSGSHDSRIIYNGEVVETTWDHGYEAVSALLMKESVSNEYSLIKPVRGTTEWVMTIPTLKFHLQDQANKPIEEKNFYYGEGSPYNYAIAYSAYDIEGWKVRPYCLRITCLYLPNIKYLSQQTAVFSFYNTGKFDHYNSLLSHQNNLNTYGFLINPFNLPEQQRINAQQGYLKLHFTKQGVSHDGYQPQASLTGTNTVTGQPQTYYGLPAIGFAAHFSYNDAIQSVYSRSQNYRTTRRITDGEGN